MKPQQAGALACALFVQAAAQPPLTFQDIRSKARPAPEQGRLDALVAERKLQLQESRGFLREGPTLSLQAGPRRIPGAPATTDKGFEVDLPLFLSPKVRAELAESLGRTHPLLKEAAQREGSHRLWTAYLDAWLAARLVALREVDLVTVEKWLKAARARFEAGADPAFQVSLVEGEWLKIQQDLEDARVQEARSWGALAALSEVPVAPVPLAEPGPVPVLLAEDLERQLEQSPLRKALLALAEVEEHSLRLQQSLALSRWSLRGSHAQEGDEKVSRIGFAVRLPRPGEAASIRQSTEAQRRANRGTARQSLAELDARVMAALSRSRAASSLAVSPDFTKAIEAVGLRLQEGRERPSEALPIRRQLLESQMASLRRLHARHLLASELQTLLPTVVR